MENEKKNEILVRIAKFLMLHGSFVNNLGLINGKMGCCSWLLDKYKANNL